MNQSGSQSQQFTMPSGAMLSVTIAPFIDAWALMKASLKTMKGMNLKAEDLNLDMNAIGTPATLALILDRIVDFATSPEVEAALWKCAQRSLYIPAGSPIDFAGMKVTPAMFDDPSLTESAREDYARIIAALLEVNCKPFLVKALSGLIKPKASNPENQPLRSA